MSKSSPAQLALIELPPSPPRRRNDGLRRQLQAAVNAQHCNALLAELDRVAQARDAQMRAAQMSQAEHLAQLFDACERAQGLDVHQAPAGAAAVAPAGAVAARARRG